MKSGNTALEETLDLIDNDNCDKCFQAIDEDNASRLTALIQHGAKIKKAKRDEKSAVLVAAELNSWGCVEAILDHLQPDMLDQRDINDSARKLNSKLGKIFLLAAKANQTQLLQRWFTKYGEWDNLGCFFIREFGYALGHKIWKDADTGNTALHYAVLHDDDALIISIFDLDLNFGRSDLAKARNKEKETFLDYAFKLGKTNCLKKVIAGIDDGAYNLGTAIKQSNVSTVYKLLRLGCLYCLADTRQEYVLRFIISLHDRSEKSSALQEAINKDTALGQYMRASSNYEHLHKRMHEELQKLTSTAMTNESRGPSSLKA